jgi:purine-binding chemotaxis protein CheW
MIKPDGELTDMRTPAAAALILRARAQALARAPQRPPEAKELLEVLEFRLAQERYAVETKYVREVYPLKDLTPLPGTPPFVLGVVNVRGRILPVYDLKSFFALPEHGLSDLHRIIIVRGTDLEFGLLANEIAGVLSIPLKSIQPSLATLTGIGADYLKGVTADHLVILNMARILEDPRIIVQDDAEA